jgi:hypothetical protein
MMTTTCRVTDRDVIPPAVAVPISNYGVHVCIYSRCKSSLFVVIPAYVDPIQLLCVLAPTQRKEVE